MARRCGRTRGEHDNSDDDCQNNDRHDNESYAPDTHGPQRAFAFHLPLSLPLLILCASHFAALIALGR